MSPPTEAPPELRRGTPAAAGLDPGRLQRAWDLLASWAADGSVPGSAVAVARHGVVVETRAFGRATRGGTACAVVPDSVFLVASVTKPVTALAVLQLVEAGRLSLGDPVARHLEAFVGGGRERVCVEHLLTHTSGLPDMLPDNEALRARHAPLAEFVRRACACSLLFRPETRVSYQSMGTLLAAAIVERLTGLPLRDVVARDVFGPLGMASTALGIRPDLESRSVEVLIPEAQARTDYHWNFAYWRGLGAPWGGMFATVEDLLRLLLAFLGGGALAGARVLGTAAATAMVDDRTRRLPELDPAEARRQPWGLGWRRGAWGDLGSPRSFSHGGATGTLVGADPATGLACAVFSTRPGAPLHRVATAVQAAVID